MIENYFDDENKDMSLFSKLIKDLIFNNLRDKNNHFELS